MQLTNLLEDHNEKVRLLAYLVVMFAVARPLFTTLGQAWQRAEIADQLILMLNPLIGVSLEQFSAFGFGIYLGLLGLLLIDPKKRIQGLLLSFGTIIALVALSSLGLFLPNINFAQNILFLAGGVFVGGIVGGGRDLLELQTAEALEFRRAATVLFLILSLVVIVGLVEFHVTFPELINVDLTNDAVTFPGGGDTSASFQPGGLAGNVFFSIVFLITLRRFFKYESSENFFVLGPVASGKSLFLVGVYLAALDELADRGDDTPMTPSSDLIELVNELDASTESAGWEVTSTDPDAVKSLEFTFVQGRMFPRNIEIGSLDYAGEYLNELPEALISSGSDIDSSILRQLSSRVKKADTIVLILDMERYKRNDSLETEYYFEILDEADSTEVLLIATKCDIVAEEFESETGLDPVTYYDDFKEYVNDSLVREDQTIKSLVQNTAGSEVHPVYYQTTEDEDGERVPMRDVNGNVQTMGFKRLLEKIG